MRANAIALVFTRMTTIQFTGTGLPLLMANRAGRITLGGAAGNCFLGNLLQGGQADFGLLRSAW